MSDASLPDIEFDGSYFSRDPEELILECQECSDLNDWEIGFLEDILDWVQQRELTETQHNKLVEIASKYEV